ncbi:GtrA family protein [Acetobacteroides hydrogenigenes]|uniref:Putative flippase GtrA n=1 Tax=Acetobacteroides hydrogenigenes TaxID=979970 RepID=A0A4R2EJ24_9BACT|nr:GtrA family protein [Acetobacteroides hydrogenigenes]TCN68491.1 putative flippase GtrA [Acetobacteroides hydrogenigenes]
MGPAAKARSIILNIIDLFYPLFSRFMPRETFVYLVCGGGNTLLDIFLYFVFYNFVLDKQMVDLWFITISPHIAAFIMSFCITFPLGFLLAKYITFTQSDLRGHVQLFRYGVTVAMCIVFNYVFLKLFVEFFRWYPTISKIVTTVIVAVYSYLSQKHFTFKTVARE